MCRCSWVTFATFYFHCCGAPPSTVIVATDMQKCNSRRRLKLTGKNFVIFFRVPLHIEIGQGYFWDGPELFCEKTSRDRLNPF